MSSRSTGGRQDVASGSVGGRGEDEGGDGEPSKQQGDEASSKGKDARPQKQSKSKAPKKTVRGAGWAAAAGVGGGSSWGASGAPGRPWVVGKILPLSVATDDKFEDKEKVAGSGAGSRARKKKKAKEIAWDVKEVHTEEMEYAEPIGGLVDETESEWSEDQEAGVQQGANPSLAHGSSMGLASGQAIAGATATTTFKPVPPPIQFGRSRSAGIGASGQGRSRARLLLDRETLDADCAVRCSVSTILHHDAVLSARTQASRT